MVSRTTNPKAAAPKASAPTTRTTGTTRTTPSAATETGTRSATPAKRTAKTNGTATVVASPEPINKSGTPKLGKGGLEAAVLDHMTANPKGEYSPADLARVLGRSSGAIANALAKFAGQGTLTQTSERPRRYRLAGATATRRTPRKG